jgi:biotin carboxylase
LLILGGTAFQVPAILHARRLGHHVVTCDYLPENPGHQHADEYHNVSTTDQQAVLALATRLAIDGVLAYASDPAAATAAHVSAKLGLPGTSPEAVQILTNKAAFRGYLREHGFKTPRFAAARCVEDAVDAACTIGFPVMVKPCDSSGSKGVSRVNDASGTAAAYHEALRFSRCGSVIVEQWMPRRGRQIAGDGLVINGALVFDCFGDEHFDIECCAHAPVGESFPGELSTADHEKLLDVLQRLFGLLGIHNLVFNLDAIIDAEGDLVLIEVGPRAGGNGLPQIIQRHTGVDLTDIAIRLALGVSVPPDAYRSTPSGFHSTWIIHARAPGRLSDIRVAPEVSHHVRLLESLVKPGAAVRKFVSAADTLGYALLSFPSAPDMQRALGRMSGLLEPVLE